MKSCREAESIDVATTRKKVNREYKKRCCKAENIGIVQHARKLSEKI
jgi:hypothetical protein